MKTLIVLLLCAGTVFAQSNSCSTDNTACTKAFQSDSAQIITTTGNISLSVEETATLKHAIEEAQQAKAAAKAAIAQLQTVQQAIAANHSAPATGPYQIFTDFSTTIDQVPPVAPPPVQVWVKMANENDIVLIKAGTTVRYGAPKGSISSVPGVLTIKDYWNPPVTYTVDTTLQITNSAYPPDPISGTPKELDMLGTAGGVTKQ